MNQKIIIIIIIIEICSFNLNSSLLTNTDTHTYLQYIAERIREIRNYLRVTSFTSNCFSACMKRHSRFVLFQFLLFLYPFICYIVIIIILLLKAQWHSNDVIIYFLWLLFWYMILICYYYSFVQEAAQEKEW